eukprot:gnl/TRDRNA2_/TRDRNA2_157337_c0_seq2.p1 gnl/TRDRNA2_/TRDRNA2_157337_c0~~gnl/TRDRNA2_/TRDRNA2_157337_c0_seq2.p1  ORF type:complete len:112 (+),score=4.12 gnl/TRDRNA2_/TRDRNA2_157337_c0_seq2:181-516(+)
MVWKQQEAAGVYKSVVESLDAVYNRNTKAKAIATSGKVPKSSAGHKGGFFSRIFKSGAAPTSLSDGMILHSINCIALSLGLLSLAVVSRLFSGRRSVLCISAEHGVPLLAS